MSKPAVFEFIHAEKANHAIVVLCEVLGVSRPGYYAWRDRAPSAHARRDAELSAKIRAIHREHEGRYGAPRIHRELVGDGERTGRKRVARLMAENGLHGRCGRLPGPKTTRRDRAAEPAVPDLVGRLFDPDAPDRIWAGDITYVRTRQGWLYVAVVIDLFSRRVVGWAMASHMRAELVCDALRMAIHNRRPAPGLIFHSDRGSQYFSGECRSLLAEHRIRQSAGRVGTCWDNAAVETFFATLKCELTFLRSYATRAQARSDIYRYIEGYYNRKRMHSFCDYLSPVDYERRL